jgi:hypothetical protein
MLRALDFSEFEVRNLVAVNTGSGANWQTRSGLVTVATETEIHIALRGLTDGPRELATLAPGTIVRVVRGRDLSVRGQVIALEHHPAPMLVVRALQSATPTSGANQRAHHRVPTCLKEAAASAVTAGKAVGFSVRVVDLSGGGARITCARPLAAGDTLVLRIALPRTDAVVEAPGRVMWARPVRSLWEIGVRFEKLLPATQDAIVRAVQMAEIELRRVS